jgi:hypothetical protein
MATIMDRFGVPKSVTLLDIYLGGGLIVYQLKDYLGEICLSISIRNNFYQQITWWKIV